MAPLENFSISMYLMYRVIFSYITVFQIDSFINVNLNDNITSYTITKLNKITNVNENSMHMWYKKNIKCNRNIYIII